LHTLKGDFFKGVNTMTESSNDFVFIKQYENYSPEDYHNILFYDLHLLYNSYHWIKHEVMGLPVLLCENVNRFPIAVRLEDIDLKGSNITKPMGILKKNKEVIHFNKIQYKEPANLITISDIEYAAALYYDNYEQQLLEEYNFLNGNMAISIIIEYPKNIENDNEGKIYISSIRESISMIEIL
jgi:hypothetical protein